MTSNRTESETVPLVVDLDRTFLLVDVLFESMRTLFLAPMRLLQLVRSAPTSRSALKAELARIARPDLPSLPVHEPLRDWIVEERARGRRVVLATASDESIAQEIASIHGCFDEVLASNAKLNLKGTAKRDALVARFGQGAFDYVGDSTADRPVWEAARGMVVIRRGRGRVERGVRTPSVREFEPLESTLAAAVRQLRVHQWVKNALVFIPIVTSGALFDGPTWARGVLVFVGLSAMASAGYVINDFVDVESDRAHPRKRARALASGHLPFPAALVLLAALLTIGTVAGLSGGLALALWGYLCASLTYSLLLKQVAGVDVAGLALLYCYRIGLGGAETQHYATPWLLAFAFFLFFGLALLKRVRELADARERGGEEKLRGRGYRLQDEPVVQQFGIASSLISVIVLAMYIQDSPTRSRFTHPDFLWATTAIVLVWQLRLWLAVGRGGMDDDPVSYALRDKVSLLSAVAVALTFIFALL